MAFSPVPCWAATPALPWDQTLIVLQDTLSTYAAPAAIGLALSGAIILHALGGRDEQARRLFGSALGGCIALTVVKLLNYVLPWTLQKHLNSEFAGSHEVRTITKPLRSVQVRVMLAGDLNASLDD